MTITHEQRCEIARHVQVWTLDYLTSHTDIRVDLAVKAATEAANEHGRMLRLMLEEGSVTVKERSGQ